MHTKSANKTDYAALSFLLVAIFLHTAVNYFWLSRDEVRLIWDAGSYYNKSLQYFGTFKLWGWPAILHDAVLQEAFHPPLLYLLPIQFFWIFGPSEFTAAMAVSTPALMALMLAI